MIRLIHSTGISLCVACLFSQASVLADEMTSTSTTVQNAGQTETVSATAGNGGAKVSRTKVNVHGNDDGSISTTREHESRTVGEAGTAHHESSASTTINPDGSSSTIKEESHTTTP